MVTGRKINLLSLIQVAIKKDEKVKSATLQTILAESFGS